MTATKPDVILSAFCDEPEGLVERFVRPLYFTPDNLRTFWNKTKQFKYLFDTNIRGDFKAFCELLVSESPSGGFQSNGLYWVIDDFVGVYSLTHIRLGIDGHVHYTFLDRRHRGRLDLTKEMIRFVFQKYRFRRLTVEIPFYATQSAFRFINQLGFVKEGRKRKAAWHNDDWFDVAIFGLLREEALG